MFENFTVGTYFPGRSALHRLDPRSKLFTSAVLMILIFSFNPGYIFAALALGILALTRFSGVELRYYLRNIRTIWFLLLITLIVNAMSWPSDTLLSVGLLKLSSIGIMKGLLACSRLVLVIILVSTFTYTTSPQILTDSLEKLFKPLQKIGFPGHEAAVMTGLAMRLIPTMLEEGNRLVWASQARGGDIGRGGLFRGARDIYSITVPLIISAFRRADELAMAMESRCYDGVRMRTSYQLSQPNKLDYIISACTGAGLILYLIVFVIGWGTGR